MITNNEHVMSVCKLGQGAECCKYLTLGVNTGWECAKGTRIGAEIDTRVDMTAKGDNCEGVKL